MDIFNVMCRTFSGRKNNGWFNIYMDFLFTFSFYHIDYLTITKRIMFDDICQ